MNSKEHKGLKPGDFVKIPWRLRSNSIREHATGCSRYIDQDSSLRSCPIILIAMTSTARDCDCMVMLSDGTTGWAWTSDLKLAHGA